MRADLPKGPDAAEVPASEAAEFRVLSRLALGTALLLPIGVLIVPLVSVRDFHELGPVPRDTMWQAFGWPAVMIACAIVVYVALVTLVGRRALVVQSPAMASVALGLSCLLGLGALVGFVTLIAGVFVMPTAALSTLASIVALSSARRGRHARHVLSPS